jgi:predicted transcriptional regulator
MTTEILTIYSNPERPHHLALVYDSGEGGIFELDADVNLTLTELDSVPGEWEEVAEIEAGHHGARTAKPPAKDEGGEPEPGSNAARILAYLRKEGEGHGYAIAKALNISRGRVSIGLRQLEDKGLVTGASRPGAARYDPPRRSYRPTTRPASSV